MDAVLTATGEPAAALDGLDRLRDLIAAAARLVVLTGAGCSTASGIPEYRDDTGRWKGAEPILYDAFRSDPELRKRYWARSLNGFPRIAHAAPNAAHRALAALEARGRLHALVTQNVDGLHARAGSRRVIELHGNLDTVVCLDCGARLDRDVLQTELERSNPAWVGTGGTTRPDGDAVLPEAADYSSFAVPSCAVCSGLLKPDVVFFGEAVPKARSEAAMQRIREADTVLVVGSSLMVLSGFRLVRDAWRRGVPVAAINRGTTRADDYLVVKVDAPCEDALEGLLAG